jgi:probable rRNA maturation factor
MPGGQLRLPVWKALVKVEVVNRQKLVAVTPDEIAALTRDAIIEIGKAVEIPSTAGLAIAIVRAKEMRRLNRLYRGKDMDTDVISFPAGRGYNSAADSYLGDLAICADVALRQAAEAGISIEREIAELVIHGVLHLAGYDHETDNGEMNRLELKLRRRLLDSPVRAHR